MNKLICVLLLVFGSTIHAQIKPSLVDIPVDVFVNGGNTNLETILYDQKGLKKHVNLLYDNKEIVHGLTGPNDSFESYWEAFGNQWYRIRFRKNGTPLLLFSGLNSFSDEREYLEIYDPVKEEAPRLFVNTGRLIAFKHHPLTNELILYTHSYPCCRSASHNIFTLRYINGEVKSKDRFFVGRDSGDMVGPFFPEEVYYDTTYYSLNDDQVLRWSPKIVNKNAFIQRANENIIAHYNKGAIYKILAKQEEWLFVIMFSGIAKDPTPVINPINFKYKGVYGWIPNSP